MQVNTMHPLEWDCMLTAALLVRGRAGSAPSRRI